MRLLQHIARHRAPRRGSPDCDGDVLTATPPTPARAPAEHGALSGRRLTLNYLLLTGGEALAKVFTLVAFAYLGRVLGPERYGSLEFILATMIFFTLPVDFGLGVYGARELARNRRNAADLLREVSSLRLMLASCSFAVLLVVAALLPREPEVKLLLVFYGLSLFVEPLLVQWFFQGQDRMHWVAVADLTRKAAFAALVLLMVRPGTPVVWVAAAEWSSAVAAAVVCLSVLHWRLGFPLPRPWSRPQRLNDHIRASAPIGLSHLAWALQWYFATVLMGWLAVGAEVGWFGASHRVVMALHSFVYLYFYNLLPSFSRGAAQPTERLPHLLSISLSVTTWGGILVALGVTLVGGALLGQIYDERYLGAGRPLAVLSWLIPVALVGGHYRYLLIASNLQQLELRCTLLAAVTAVALGVCLIPLYGAVGAAAALLLAGLVSGGLAYGFVNRRIVRIPCHRQLALPLVALSVALACYTALTQHGPWLAAGVAGLAYLALFGVWVGWYVLRGGLVLAPAEVAIPNTT
jgi:O-antigen/teichoic acid export membrane protein